MCAIALDNVLGMTLTGLVIAYGNLYVHLGYYIHVLHFNTITHEKSIYRPWNFYIVPVEMHFCARYYNKGVRYIHYYYYSYICLYTYMHIYTGQRWWRVACMSQRRCGNQQTVWLRIGRYKVHLLFNNIHSYNIIIRLLHSVYSPFVFFFFYSVGFVTL